MFYLSPTTVQQPLNPSENDDIAHVWVGLLTFTQGFSGIAESEVRPRLLQYFIIENGDECQGRKDINVNPKGQIKTISLTRPKGPPKDNFLERIWDPLFEKQTIAW